MYDTQQPMQHDSDEDYDRLPVHCEVRADLETAVSCYLKLANTPYSYLFESVEGGEKWSRYSIIGLQCDEVIRICGNTIDIQHKGQSQQQLEHPQPLDWLKNYIDDFKVATIDELPDYSGGWVGYFGYDCVRYIEPRLQNHDLEDELQTPDIILMRSEDILVFDNLYHKIHIITHIDPKQQDYAAGVQKLQAIKQRLAQPLVQDIHNIEYPSNPSALDFSAHTDKNVYLQNVEKIRDYISAGDAMQVVYSQRWSTDFKAPPFELYRTLRSLNPSPYLFYLHLDDIHIIGSSPEILVREQAGTITVRPLAGTRPRGANAEQDKQLEEELLADPKEIAEHLMLIDLGRNDVGKISQSGSVNVTEHMNVERYSHVMHVVSEVQGLINNNTHCLEALTATLPAGTLSGAPKSRAMAIIDELEHEKRGIYGGAVGYISWQGHIDTAIAIRTAVLKNQRLYVQAGAGIVYDSIPENEWQECFNKASAIFKAAEKVAQGE